MSSGGLAAKILPPMIVPSKIRLAPTEKRLKDRITRANHEDDEAGLACASRYAACEDTHPIARN